MNYWEGYMNWPLAEDWVCQTCQSRAGLTWGLINGECRCDKCHTEYYMRDENQKVVDTPICMLKEEYKKPARIGYEKWHKPLEEWSDYNWDTAIEEANK